MNLTTQSQIEAVKEIIKSKTDVFIIDEHTGAYNEFFLREYLDYDIHQMQIEDNSTDTINLLYFNIDNLMEINVKYNPEIGDETITNTHYLIRQLKKADDLLFKRNGPGFILYSHCSKKVKTAEVAAKFQGDINRAEIFVEAISVSISSVSLSEYDLSENSSILRDKILSTGAKRINIVPSMGPNAFLDRDIPTKKATIGKVLLVENDPLSQKVFQNYFQNNGVEVFIAEDGALGLEMMASLSVDAIIAEKNIPKLDGISLKKRLNDSTLTMNTLFILVTHRKTVEIVVRGNELRIDYIVEKPLIFEEILGFIQREIRKRGYHL